MRQTHANTYSYVYVYGIVCTLYSMQITQIIVGLYPGRRAQARLHSALIDVVFASAELCALCGHDRIIIICPANVWGLGGHEQRASGTGATGVVSFWNALKANWFVRTCETARKTRENVNYTRAHIRCRFSRVRKVFNKTLHAFDSIWLCLSLMVNYLVGLRATLAPLRMHSRGVNAKVRATGLIAMENYV